MFTSPPYTENDASAPALWVESSVSEGAYTTIDFLSNGFKMRSTSAYYNANEIYIYMAFAEMPFKYANAR